MATSFPSGLDAFTNPSSSDTLDNPPHDQQHADVNDAVEALQAKVGVDSSAVTSSLDYKVANATNKLGSGAASSVLGTFTAGAELTAAELNQFNNVTALYGSGTSIPNNVGTPLQYTTAGMVVVDTSGWHDTATNPSRITVDKNGVYLVGGSMQFNYNSTAAAFYTNISKNGSVVLDVGGTEPYYPSNSISGVLSANAGDYFELLGYQNSGGTVGLLAGRNAFYVVLLRTT